MTFLFGDQESRGSRLVDKITRDMDRHLVLSVERASAYPPQWSVDNILHWTGIKVINIAGNRESSAPGIGVWVESYLVEVFRLLAEDKS
jgi:hypothetical protein